MVVLWHFSSCMAVQRSHGSFKDFVASRTYKLRARSARSSRVQSQKLLFLAVCARLRVLGFLAVCARLRVLGFAEQEQELFYYSI
jgi:hypothetical protein